MITAKKELPSSVVQQGDCCMWFTPGAAMHAALFQQERRRKMKDESTIVEYTREELDAIPDETDWEKVDAMTDEEVLADAMNDPDAQPTDEAFWATAKQPGHFLSIEPEILEWFKASQEDYEAFVNAVLRDYVSAHQNAR